MTTLAWVIVVVLVVFTLVLFGALVELHRQLAQLRSYVGLLDDAQPVPFNLDAQVSELGIPSLYDLGDEGRAAVLVLSDSCSVCREIAESLPSVLPETLAVLLHSPSAANALQWLADRRLVPGAQVIYDDGGTIAEALGVEVTPVIVKVEGRRPLAASTVPSTRQMGAVLDWLTGVYESSSASLRR